MSNFGPFDYLPYIGKPSYVHVTAVGSSPDHSKDFTLIRACLTVLGADAKNATLVSVAVDALDRIEKGGK
jgi:hypothetical protein